MIVTTHHDLKAELKAAGWRIAKSGIPDPINIADWYAWNPIRKSARDCCSKKKPPVVTVDPFEYTYNASAEIRLSGELPNGRWVDFRVYSIPNARGHGCNTRRSTGSRICLGDCMGCRSKWYQGAIHRELTEYEKS